MSVLGDPLEYQKNPLYYPQVPSDYSPFYITLLFCAIFALFLLILNVYFCCFSKYKQYWLDSKTGNRWLLSIWIQTPYKQTPLDLKEFEDLGKPSERSLYHTHIPEDYHELKKKESDI